MASIEIDSPDSDPDGQFPIPVSMTSPLTVGGTAFTEGFTDGPPTVQCFLRFFDAGQTPDKPSNPVTVTPVSIDGTTWNWTATFSYVPPKLQEAEAYAVLVGTSAPAAGPDVFWIQPIAEARK